MAENRVPGDVVGVYAYPTEDVDGAASQYVLFQDASSRQVRIFVGQSEASAIAAGLAEIAWDRPLTCEAMLACLSAAGATVEEVTINELKDETFYAFVSLRVGDNVHQIDMRPSDAVSLAVRVKCPLLMNEDVIKAVGDANCRERAWKMLEAAKLEADQLAAQPQ